MSREFPTVIETRRIRRVLETERSQPGSDEYSVSQSIVPVYPLDRVEKWPMFTVVQVIGAVAGQRGFIRLTPLTKDIEFVHAHSSATGNTLWVVRGSPIAGTGGLVIPPDVNNAIMGDAPPTAQVAIGTTIGGVIPNNLVMAFGVLQVGLDVKPGGVVFFEANLDNTAFTVSITWRERPGLPTIGPGS